MVVGLGVGLETVERAGLGHRTRAPRVVVVEPVQGLVKLGLSEQGLEAGSLT